MALRVPEKVFMRFHRDAKKSNVVPQLGVMGNETYDGVSTGVIKRGGQVAECINVYHIPLPLIGKARLEMFEKRLRTIGFAYSDKSERMIERKYGGRFAKVKASKGLCPIEADKLGPSNFQHEVWVYVMPSDSEGRLPKTVRIAAITGDAGARFRKFGALTKKEMVELITITHLGSGKKTGGFVGAVERELTKFFKERNLKRVNKPVAKSLK